MAGGSNAQVVTNTALLSMNAGDTLHFHWQSTDHAGRLIAAPASGNYPSQNAAEVVIFG